jgi:hypothetical protein
VKHRRGWLSWRRFILWPGVAVFVVTGFYRTCVIDGVLDHLPAEYVRRPTVPAESPTLGRSHLQFEAMLAAAKASRKDGDFGEEHSHRVRVASQGLGRSTDEAGLVGENHGLHPSFEPELGQDP